MIMLIKSHKNKYLAINAKFINNYFSNLQGNKCLIMSFLNNNRIILGSAMDTFETAPPNYSIKILEQIALSFFNKKGEIKPLVSERDQNARLITKDGEFVLKIANSAEDKKIIEFQNAVLNHIAVRDPQLAVPVVIKGINGKEIFDYEGHNIRLISFLKGDIFDQAVKNNALYENLGRFMGRFSCAMRDFDHEKAHNPDFLWNLDNANFSKQYISDIIDVDDKKLMEYYFDRYDLKIRPRLDKLPCAVIHSDANNFNLVVKDDQISGLIDFGDMLYAKQINELAITLGYAVLDVDDIVGVSAALIKNYCREFPLSNDELEIVIDLAAMRLVMSICISSNRASKASSSEHREYLVITQAPALRTLMRLKELDLNYLAKFAISV